MTNRQILAIVVTPTLLLAAIMVGITVFDPLERTEVNVCGYVDKKTLMQSKTGSSSFELQVKLSDGQIKFGHVGMHSTIERGSQICFRVYERKFTGLRTYEPEF